MGIEPAPAPGQDPGGPENALFGREQGFRMLIESIPGVVTYVDLITDEPGVSIPQYISPQVEQMLGYPVRDWLGNGELFLRIQHPDDREQMAATESEARDELAPMSSEYRLIARDGHVVWVSEKAAIVIDVHTGSRYWQGVMVDITERKRAEEAMRDSELKFRTIFDAAAFGVLTVDLRGRIDEANQTVEQLGGYGPGELNGRPTVTLIHSEDAETLTAVSELLLGRRERCEVEHRFLRADESAVWCRTVMALVRAPDGGPAYAIAMLEDISDRKEAEDELVRRALHDPLTGLPNRSLLLDRLAVDVARSERHPETGVAVIFLDLDDFKEVNDTLGHRAGDELLVAVADRLSRAVRPSDTVARYGGDEFVVLVGDVPSVAEAKWLGERIGTVIRGVYRLEGRDHPCTASVGVTLGTDPDATPQSLLREADMAMYMAKADGRDRTMVFDSAARAGGRLWNPSAPTAPASERRT
jgi:diguanylate cyclase (GGDEF)-like protein/PAS domain S-box-containing protein